MLNQEHIMMILHIVMVMNDTIDNIIHDTWCNMWHFALEHASMLLHMKCYKIYNLIHGMIKWILEYHIHVWLHKNKISSRYTWHDDMISIFHDNGNVYDVAWYGIIFLLIHVYHVSFV